MDIIHPALWKAARLQSVDERASWLYLFAWAGIESPEAELIAQMRAVAAS